MKSLSTVIEALEYCQNPADDLGNCKEECPYIHNCDLECTAVKADALHYLKEFQGLSKMWNDKLDKEQTNPALTWDELRTMAGKPVWVEWYELIDETCDDIHKRKMWGIVPHIDNRTKIARFHVGQYEYNTIDLHMHDNNEWRNEHKEYFFEDDGTPFKGSPCADTNFAWIELGVWQAYRNEKS